MCWDQMQGSIKPAFNKQTQAQADEAKKRRSLDPRLASVQESHMKIKHGHEPHVGSSIQKKLKS